MQRLEFKSSANSEVLDPKLGDSELFSLAFYGPSGPQLNSSVIINLKQFQPGNSSTLYFQIRIDGAIYVDLNSDHMQNVVAEAYVFDATQIPSLFSSSFSEKIASGLESACKANRCEVSDLTGCALTPVIGVECFVFGKNVSLWRSASLSDLFVST